MSDEYIRKADAVDELQSEPIFSDAWNALREARDRIKAIKPADVAPVVRCGQCGYWHSSDGDYGYCYVKDGQGFGHAWGKNDFCSYGEREEL